VKFMTTCNLRKMMYYLKALCSVCFCLLFNSSRLDSQNWHQKVDYQIDVRLDDQTNSIQAREKVKYVNASPDTLKTIYFRLAWHGRASQVSSRFTVFSVQQNGVAIDFEILESKPDPAVPPQSLSQNLLAVKLSRPLPPGDSDTYNIAWQADVPVFSGGCGRNSPSGVDYTFTNWYPQACVYDRLGWHLGSPFSADYSSEFGSFKVDITMPPKYMVAATGILTNADAIGYGFENQGVVLKPNYGLVTVWKFQAEKVRDFAWVADPELLHEKKQVRNGLTLHAFYFKNENRLTALESALNNLEKSALTYSFPQLSVVQMGEMRAEFPMLIFAAKEVPNLAPVISWDFQTPLLKSTYLLKQFRYAMGDIAFKNGLAEIAGRYRYGFPVSEESIHSFEKSSGLELDWIWEQNANTRAQVDYAIQSVKTEVDNSMIVLERIKGAVLPVTIEVIYADSTTQQLYIPVAYTQGVLPAGLAATPQPVWPAEDKKYTLKLNKPLESIKSLVIDPQELSGDVDPENNRKDF